MYLFGYFRSYNDKPVNLTMSLHVIKMHCIMQCVVKRKAKYNLVNLWIQKNVFPLFNITTLCVKIFSSVSSPMKFSHFLVQWRGT